MEVGVIPKVASPTLNLSLEEDSALVTSAFQVCAHTALAHVPVFIPGTWSSLCTCCSPDARRKSQAAACMG